MAGERILIVEDEMITAMDEKQQLQKMGYEVVAIVNTGEAAIEAAEYLHPDVVLMDITLKSGMTGESAARSIRRQFRIPVVFVTASGNKAIFEAASQGELTGYIVKPFDPRRLKDNIEAAMRGELTPEGAISRLRDQQSPE